MNDGNIVYNGNYYHVALTVLSAIKDYPVSKPNNENVSILMYDKVDEMVIKNSIKDFLLNGHLIYTDDSIPVLAKFIESPICYLYVTVTKLRDLKSTYQNIDIEEKVFNHVFIIDKISKLKQDGQFTTYRLDFISELYWNFFANILYSTNATGPESPIGILESLYAISNVKLTPPTFSTDVVLPYITSSSECLISAQNYLMKRCFDRKNPQNPGIFSIIYDHIENTFEFWRLQDYIKNFIDSSDVQTNNAYEKYNKHSIKVNIYNTQVDKYENEDVTTLNTYQKQFSTTLFDLIQETTYWDFDYDKNIFIAKNTTHPEFINNFIPGITDKPITYTKKYIINDENLTDTLPKSQRVFSKDSSRWSESIFPYNDLMTLFMESNYSIVNTAGEITRKPGESYQLIIDKTDANSISHLEGDWVSFGVEHIFTKNKYRNNIYLGRFDRATSEIFK